MSCVLCSLWYADAGKHIAERALGLLGKVGVDRWIWSVRPHNDITQDILRFIAQDDPRVEIFVEPEDQPEDRMVRLSRAGDRLLDMVKDEDFVAWHESDLLSYPTVIVDLKRSLKESGADVIGAWTSLSHHDKHPALRLNSPVQCKLPVSIHYDTWALRKDGVRFTNNPPYHPCMEEATWPMLDSVGSVVLMNADYIRRGARMGAGALVGLCNEIRRLGGWITVDRDVPAVQPVETWKINND